MSRFTVWNFLSHVIEKHRGRTLLCLRKFLVGKDNGWERGVTFFRRKIFVSRRRKTTWANHSVFRNCSGLEFFLCIRGNTILSIFFVSQYQKFGGGTVVSQKCSGIKRFLDNQGITVLSNFLVSHRQKSSWLNRSVFWRHSGIKIFWIMRYHYLVELLCLMEPNYCGEPFNDS